MTLRVALTAPLLQEAMTELQRFAETDVVTDLATLYDFDAAITTLSNTLDAAFFEQMPAGAPLKLVSNYAVGYDNIDLKAASASAVWVSNTPDVLTEATAELAFALMLSASRRLQEGDTLVRSGRWQGWEPTQLLGRGLKGKVLGVVGAGRIGQATARMAAGFGMQIIYTSRQDKPDFEHALSARRVTLKQLCEQADYVSLHLPGGPDTRHTLDRQHIHYLKPTAYVINTGRGTLIDEQALTEALTSHRISGAALDVFEREPQVAKALRDCANVTLTPHLGSATREARLAMARCCFQSIQEACVKQRRPDLALNQF